MHIMQRFPGRIETKGTKRRGRGKLPRPLKILLPGGQFRRREDFAGAGGGHPGEKELRLVLADRVRQEAHCTGDVPAGPVPQAGG